MTISGGTVSALGIRLKTLSNENGRTSLIPAIAQRMQINFLGIFGNKNLIRITARII